MEKLQNLKDHICSFDNLVGAYKDAAKNKRYRGEVLKFGIDLEKNLIEIREELIDRRYRVGRYREFYVRYPKPRLVMALSFRDRIVQWAIYRQINPFIDKHFIDHSYGCRAGKGTLAAAECLMDWLRLVNRKPDADDYVIIKGDISKYFYRVDHEISLELYREYTDDEWFMWLMDMIINNEDVPFGLPPWVSADECPREERLFDVGMPIGNLTSQETANIYLNRLDQFCKHGLKLRYYERYMDDFIIVMKGRRRAEEVMRRITAFLKSELKLDASPKCRIIPAGRGCEFVGYRVSPHGLRLRKSTVRHVKSALLHVAEMHKAGVLDYESVMQTLSSYMGMLKHCNSYSLRLWISENFALTKEAGRQKEGDLCVPGQGKRFYYIEELGDGTADVYLSPRLTVYATDAGIREYDVDMRIVRGVVLWDGVEEDIRRRYEAWCAEGEDVFA